MRDFSARDFLARYLPTGYLLGRDPLASVPAIVRWMIAVYAIVLNTYSIARHLLFHSTAFDLSYFDQTAYLISQGQTPIVSFWGYHFLGGHADWILYPIALLYKLVPSVYWLFTLQAIALSFAGLPLWWLTQSYGLSKQQGITLVAVYLLQPLVFNVNLFDFHPEVLAIPCLFAAVLAARGDRFLLFLGLTIFSLGCRDSLSLNIAALGLWLGLFERRWRYGLTAFILGTAWFGLATQVMIPTFRPGGVEAVARYGVLGDSLGEIIRSLFTRPDLVAQQLLTLPNLEYMALLLAPLLWGLHWRSLPALLPGLPTLMLNLLTSYQPQKDLVHQYSLPILPWFLMAILIAMTQKQTWLKSRRSILIWSLITFLVLAKYSYLGTRYLSRIDTWQATRRAIALVQPQSSLLTSNSIAPHLAHRTHLKLTVKLSPITSLAPFDEVLLNSRHPGESADPAAIAKYQAELDADPAWQRIFAQDGVILWRRKSDDRKVSMAGFRTRLVF
ncbi:MAG: DUF2079 domain-containing protein [Synechococcales bacterium]|nr:DUF2079 domain-containing protein [Synechococcales bacterium]